MGWLVSARVDGLFIIGPGLLAAVYALALPVGAPCPPWLWVVAVLCVDVAHVWATLFRVYLQPGEVRRRPALYLGGPAAVFAGLLALAAVGPAVFWRVLAYVAAFHFVRQVVGIGMLYRARAGLSTTSPDARWERGALYAVTVGPLLWWHTELPRPFVWFVEGDFVALPQAIGSIGLVGCGLALAAHVVARRSGGPLGPRDLWLGSSAAAWGVGVVITEGDAAFTVTNTIAHGVPYLALVAAVSRYRWVLDPPGPWLRWSFSGAGALAMLAPLVLLAAVEELAWDALLWKEWVTGPDLSTAGAAVALALLATPQATHYLLDGYIWRRAGADNAGLAQLVAHASARVVGESGRGGA